MKKKSLEFVFTGAPMEGQIEPTASSTATIISHDTITRPKWANTPFVSLSARRSQGSEPPDSFAMALH
jgi:hypothetical protein